MTFLRSIELDRALEFSGAYSRSEGRSILSVLRAAEFSHDQDPFRTFGGLIAIAEGRVSLLDPQGLARAVVSPSAACRAPARLRWRPRSRLTLVGRRGLSISVATSSASCLRA